ncbi:putative membrane protein (TIGR01666 family) [Gramella sp. Hel_I_59]|uniref:FUSC family protein n=1 Tax=Gramella sp. Hel_I_59 TaxID=1249978 RepID=UPI001173D47E|nr:FUSC family membrane protein [Gramella sp. Hel_I_59]TQI70847.1 putative membrane protein (TIGR01666 family) [Gramella sp. Hel_I_59]
MKINFQHYYNELIKFLRSTDFSKAIVLTIAIVIPIAVFSNLGLLEIGVSMAMGSLLSSPSDVAGSFKHKVMGIMAAAFLGAISFCIAGYASQFSWAVAPMLLVMMFGIAYLSVYGFRASLVTFAGLLAVVLSFANISSEIDIWQKSILIFGGGVFYMLISIAWYLLKPERASEQQIAETMELTADYLRLRIRMLDPESDLETIQKELFQKQTELNEHHESLRELLITFRMSSGSSGYTRKRLLIFIDLVDMLELAMANPIDYPQMRKVLDSDFIELKVFKEFSLKMAEQLDRIALSVHKNSTMPVNQLSEELKKVENSLLKYRDTINISEKRESMLVLRNFYDYQTKQSQKINNIDRVLRNLEGKKRIFKDKDVQQFLTQQEYSFKTLRTNFQFNSSIFRHALRLAIVILVGYLLGSYFSVQNAYWILLTIVVIMRPNYGLTKQRTRKRIIGTLIGGAMAIGIVFITQNTTVYAILGILSLTLAFSLIQRNYTTAAMFITLSIIFIYALLQPEVLNVIQFRILDTVIGAGLAGLGNFILWPKWELKELNNVIANSINSNIGYLEEIDDYYHKKENLPISYRLARKKAFLDMGELSGAFQRMTQEPKSQQKQLSLIYEIVGLNHTFLSALASMGSYIRNHPTSKASSDFEMYTKTIVFNLKNSVRLLDNKSREQKEHEGISKAGKALHRRFDEMATERDREISEGKAQIDEDTRLNLQEAHLITGQLEWLLDISEKLEINTEKLTAKLDEQKSL